MSLESFEKRQDDYKSISSDEDDKGDEKTDDEVELFFLIALDIFFSHSGRSLSKRTDESAFLEVSCSML